MFQYVGSSGYNWHDDYYTGWGHYDIQDGDIYLEGKKLSLGVSVCDDRCSNRFGSSGSEYDLNEKEQERLREKFGDRVASTYIKGLGVQLVEESAELIERREKIKQVNQAKKERDRERRKRLALKKLLDDGPFHKQSTIPRQPPPVTPPAPKPEPYNRQKALDEFLRQESEWLQKHYEEKERTKAEREFLEYAELKRRQAPKKQIIELTPMEHWQIAYTHKLPSGGVCVEAVGKQSISSAGQISPQDFMNQIRHTVTYSELNAYLEQSHIKPFLNRIPESVKEKLAAANGPQ